MKLDLKAINDYCQDCYQRVTILLRTVEANSARGQLDRLSELDRTSDLTIITRWAWKSAIVGAIAAFGAMPLLLLVVSSFLPYLMLQFLRLIMIMCMTLAFTLFALAAYLTFGGKYSQ